MQVSVAVTYRALIDVHFSVRVDLQRFERIHRDQHRSDVGLIKIVKKNILILPNWEWTYQLGTIEGRDGVLEASASSRGGLEAVFLNWVGLASASHGLASVSTLLPRPRLCLIVSAWVLARTGR